MHSNPNHQEINLKNGYVWFAKTMLSEPADVCEKGNYFDRTQKCYYVVRLNAAVDGGSEKLRFYCAICYFCWWCYLWRNTKRLIKIVFPATFPLSVSGLSKGQSACFRPQTKYLRAFALMQSTQAKNMNIFHCELQTAFVESFKFSSLFGGAFPCKPQLYLEFTFFLPSYWKQKDSLFSNSP